MNLTETRGINYMRIISLIIISSFIFIQNVFAVLPIYCPQEKIHIYNYQKDEIIIGSPIKAIDFKPVGDIGQPREEDPMICPICGCPLNYYEYWAWKNRQKPPVFHCWAITLLTKVNGEFKWTPYEIE